MNNKNSWNLRNLIGISDTKFSIGIYPFQIRSSAVLSVIRLVEVRFTFVQHLFYPLEVRWWVYLPDLQRMYNGHVTDTKRKETDENRTKLWTCLKFSTGQNGRRRITRTLNGHATDMDGRITDKNGRLTDMNGLKKKLSVSRPFELSVKVLPRLKLIKITDHSRFPMYKSHNTEYTTRSVIHTLTE